MQIVFDLDGTLAGLYDVPNWLAALRSENPTPYRIAKPLLNFSVLAKQLHKVQKQGIKIVVVSWLSMGASEKYNQEVTKAKMNWLRKHLPSVHWDEVHIVPYGTPKENFCESEKDILFDDNAEVRTSWTGIAYTETAITAVLKEVTKE